MSAPHTVKFAVTREDPRIELEVARWVQAERVLLVASGGCTALAFAERLPAVTVELYDFNPAQIAHAHARREAVARGDLRALNVADSNPDGLGQRGAFERLFRVLHQAWLGLLDQDDTRHLEAFFDGHEQDRASLRQRWFSDPYWPVIFQLAFHDQLLTTMFGPDAVQHAPPGSYPAYFQSVFERGLSDPEAARNPFLQHVLLQRYLLGDEPSYLRRRSAPVWRAHLGGVPEVEDLASFDLVHLSNIFDWCDEVTVRGWIDSLRALSPGAAVTVRQLNNLRPFDRWMERWFDFDDSRGRQLLRMDKSLFYQRVLVGRRNHAP